MPRFPFVPMPPTLLEEEEQSSRDNPVPGWNPLSQASLDSIIFLFQLLMALALTNGAYVYLTDASGGYKLRPWNSYTLFDTVAFFVFVATLIPFVHANVLILKQAYSAGFKNRGIQPFADFVLLFIESGIFYLLSFSLATVDDDPLQFFYIVGTILAIDVLWALLTFSFDRRQRVVLIYALLNSCTVAAGAVEITLNIPHLRWVLTATLLARTSMDYGLTYNLLFPGAFSAIGQSTQGQRALGAIRGTGLLAMLLIGIALLVPPLTESSCQGACLSIQLVLVPVLVIGSLLAAVAWAMGLVRTLHQRQRLWFTALLVVTPALPLLAFIFSTDLASVGAVWLGTLYAPTVAALYALNPVAIVLYGFFGSPKMVRAADLVGTRSQRR